MSKLIPFLSANTGLSESDVRRVIIRAPVSYKDYTIDKRSGGKRLISQPAREVKALQRALVQGLDRLPIHDAAMAYRQGCSIRDNATRHASNGPIMKFDFVDFFRSIRAEDWELYCKKNSVFSVSDDISLSSKLLFHRSAGSTVLRLAIGAPSSPWLSNLLMFEIDEKITRAVGQDHVTYTRYADDLTFSAKRTGYLTVVERALRKILHEIKSPQLDINESKTVVATKKFRRVVTGLVLSANGLVTIGRERKRFIRAALHHAIAGKNTAAENVKLAGWIAFAGDIEPDYFNMLTARYGSDLLVVLSRGDAPDRST